MSDPEPMPSASSFPSTQWTQIIEVIQKGETEAATAALADFCERYRPVVYGFFRRRGCNHEQAEDYAQEFFRTRILKPWDDRNGFLHTAQRSEQGKFRSFLCQVLWRFLQDQWKAQRTAKGGGNVPHFSLEGLELDGAGADQESFKRFGSEFDRVFAWEIIRRAAERSKHSRHILAHFKGEISQKEAADKLHFSENAFRQAFHNFRKRLARDFWDEVANLVGPDENEIRAEIKYLISLFSR